MSQKQVMPKSEDLSRSLEINAIWTFDTEFPINTSVYLIDSNNIPVLVLSIILRSTCIHNIMSSSFFEHSFAHAHVDI